MIVSPASPTQKTRYELRRERAVRAAWERENERLEARRWAALDKLAATATAHNPQLSSEIEVGHAVIRSAAIYGAWPEWRVLAQTVTVAAGGYVCDCWNFTHARAPLARNGARMCAHIIAVLAAEKLAEMEIE